MSQRWNFPGHNLRDKASKTRLTLQYSAYVACLITKIPDVTFIIVHTEGRFAEWRLVYVWINRSLFISNFFNNHASGFNNPPLLVCIQLPDHRQESAAYTTLRGPPLVICNLLNYDIVRSAPKWWAKPESTVMFPVWSSNSSHCCEHPRTCVVNISDAYIERHIKRSDLRVVLLSIFSWNISPGILSELGMK